MKDFTIIIEQNGGEYDGYAYIKATSIELVNECTIKVILYNSELLIEFDEKVEICQN